MIEIKAFVSNTLNADNGPNATSKVGELSKLGSSYSRDVKTYPNQTNPEIVLNLFSSYDTADETTYVEPNQSTLSEMQQVAEYVLNQGNFNLAPSDVPSYIEAIKNNFSSWTGDFAVGNLVQQGSGWYPSSVGYETSTTSFRLWFANSEFLVQYPDYSLEVVLPVDNIDDLLGNVNTVREAILAVTGSVMLNRVAAIEADTPSTLNSGVDYTWRDRNNEEIKVPLSFGVVIYGKAGNNIDLIRNAVAEKILAESSADRSEWVKVLPEIFSPDEYMFVPNWESVQEAYVPLDDDRYTPIMDYGKMNRFITFYNKWFPNQHIQDKINFVPTLWRSIVIGAVPHEPTNDEESPTFYDKFKDYLLATTTGNDFHSMSPESRLVVNIINHLLTSAEDYTDYTVLPDGYSRTVRAGGEFITTAHDGFLYHVLTKRSFKELFPADGDN